MDKVERLIRPAVVFTRVGFGDTTIRELEKRGKFPSPIYIGCGKVKRRVWRETEIDAWIAERIAERDAQPRAA